MPGAEGGGERNPAPPRQAQPELQSPPIPARRMAAVNDDNGLPSDLQFDETARAVDFLGHPYFEDRWRWPKDDGAERSKNLGDVSLGDLLRQCFRSAWDEHVREALGKLAKLAFVRMPREFYDRLVPPELKRDLVASALKTRYKCDFRTCVLPAASVRAVLHPLLRMEAAEPSNDEVMGETYYSEERVIDLSLLNPLKVSDEEEFFVADKLYVRDAMRRVFGLFQEDAQQAHAGAETKKHKDAALSGSAGVGKAILFFLAALHRATFTRVAYYRRRPRDDRVSFFLMEPVIEDAAAEDDQDDASGGGEAKSVRIWFTRNVDTYVLQENRGLLSLSCHILDGLTLDKKKMCTFLDGPRMKEEAEDCCGSYNYICTNGPRFYKWWHYETRHWLLGGWSEDDGCRALHALGYNVTNAGRSVFDLCGGNIRDMVHAVVDYDKVQARLDRIVAGLDKDVVTLIGSSSHRPDNPRNRDRLRTVFEGPRAENEGEDDNYWKQRMRGHEVVDSPYLLRRMNQVLDVSHFHQTYRFWDFGRDVALHRAWFTRLVHKCAYDAALDPELEAFDEICWSTESRDECARSLMRPNVYWIPSDSGYSTVDAALVVGTALYVFHTGMQETSVLDETELRTRFVSAVARQMSLERVVVCFVHAQDSSRHHCHDLSTIRGRRPTSPKLSPSKRRRRSGRRSGGGAMILPRPIPIVYGRHLVRTYSQESCAESLLGLFRNLDESITYF